MPPLKPLPDCEGPKLEPFTQDITAHDVEFLEIPCYDCAHGVIAKIKIDGQVYCLKMFFNRGPFQGFFAKDGSQKPPKALDKVLSDHNDHFHCECRAFGRLKQVGREHLAVRVYGYISLPMNEDIMNKMHRAMEGDPGWDIWDDDSNREVTRHPRDLLEGPCWPEDTPWCVMGILKDWVGPIDRGPSRSTYEEGLDLLRLPSMFRTLIANLKALHQCGIVVCDIHPDQWVDGVLVDLSFAMTIPHVYGPGGALERPGWTFASVAAWDLWCFQTYIIDWWNNIDWAKYFPGVTPPGYKSTSHIYSVQESQKTLLPGHPPPGSTAGSLAEQQGKRMREGLRPRPMRHGPYLPLLNNKCRKLDLVELPRYDPAEFDWMRLEVGKGKTRALKPKVPATSSPRGEREEKINKRRTDGGKRQKPGPKKPEMADRLGDDGKESTDGGNMGKKRKRRDPGSKTPETIDASGKRVKKKDGRRADAKSKV